MHDIRMIRDDADAFDRALARRGVEKRAASILEVDEKRRALQTELQALQQRRNDKSKEIGEIKKTGGDAAAAMEEVAKIKDSMAGIEDEEKKLGEALDGMLMELPNILDDEVAEGKDEASNVEIRRSGNASLPEFKPRDHVDIGEGLGMMDFGLAAKISGARFVVLRDGLARLERALASFMLDIHCGEFGYEEVLPPSLVNEAAVRGTGQLPKFAEDLFQTTDGRWLIPTAEVSLTNIVADEILDGARLPLRFTGYTPCYRAEAGAAGRDTRGMIRQHQFSKVELVSIAHPDESDKELDRMTNCAETVLQRLGLPYRVVMLCSGDTGFSARRTYDIEVWLPGQEEGKGAFREISSCSNCGPFQARRMGARFRDAGGKETRHVHTLNGSGLAIGRTVIAILENYQREDGSVAIPDALQPYMGGLAELKPADRPGGG